MLVITKAKKTFNPNKKIRRPFFSCSISAGFPSPADDYVEKVLDLNDLCITNPVATYFVRVSGDSMIGAGIHDKDILVVDKSLEPTNNKIVVAFVNGEFTVKRIRYEGSNIYLLPENEEYSSITVEDEHFQIFGVVTFVIHSVK